MSLDSFDGAEMARRADAAKHKGSRLILETECPDCEGRGDGGGFDRNGSLTENRYVEYPCRRCEGSGGSQIILDPDQELFIIVAMANRLLTVQDFLDALEDTE